MKTGPVQAMDRGTVRRIADHLRTLSDKVIDIEAHVSDSMRERYRPDDPMIASLQHLDFLRQSLEDVAHLLDALNTTGDLFTHRMSEVKMETTLALLEESRKASRRPPEDGSVDLF